MSKRFAASVIRLRGVRQNNLKNFDLDLPVGRLVVVTGPSGSGKSSLAFDTLYAEGQRRYIETFSPYARQFFDRMDKPRVDRIDGIPPAIAIEQRNTVKTTRSTVGTMTEICDYMKVVWSHLAQLFCRRCGQPVRKDSPDLIWRSVTSAPPGAPDTNPEMLIAFDLQLSDKLSLEDSLALVSKQGYQRLLVPSAPAESPVCGNGPQILRIDEAMARLQSLAPKQLTVLQDRVALVPANRSRFVDGCEQAYHFGRGRLTVCALDGRPPRRFSNHVHCAQCDLEYREPTPALFSFNHPVGACPTCRGFGRTITIDYDLAIPDRALSLAQGAVKPWQTGQSAECQDDLLKFCKLRKVPINVPFQELPKQWQDWVLEGDPEYGKDPQRQWPHAWYGVKGYFRWLESRTYRMHVRVLLARYRAYRTCADCNGQRFQPEALLFKIPDSTGTLTTLADFYRMPASEGLRFVEALIARKTAFKASDPLFVSLNEVHARLGYLNEVGLGYVTLDRATRTLSGGETERVSLTTCLGSRLVSTLFVLDEPSVGLHARDTERLVKILKRLRDAGNTVVVVEHEASVMQAADQIVDLGPGHGEAGGHVVFQGSIDSIVRSHGSLTGRYLSGRKKIPIPQRRNVTPDRKKLVLSHATLHNLNDLTVEIPLERLVCLTGVSGSGKTTLIRGVLLPALEKKIRSQESEDRGQESEVRREKAAPKNEGRELGSFEDETTPPSSNDLELTTDNRPLTTALSGAEPLGRVVLVDQSPIGKTPRSTPAVYTGAFDSIRELFARSELARQRGLKASAFSFNSSQGQCERCRGAGFEKIEMQFLSDVYVRCPDCDGRRYRSHILEIGLAAPQKSALTPPSGDSGLGLLNFSKKSRKKTGQHPDRVEMPLPPTWNVADLLEATIDEGIQFLSAFSDVAPACEAVSRLKLLAEVGLGYLRLGQPINTLSGGECQRLKLVSHLADFSTRRAENTGPALFLFDEPTTGLHFDDIAVLLRVFQRLVDAGHSVVIIEHNLDVIKCADWVIDLGPEAGEQGGRIVVQGPPEHVAACHRSHTGRALREIGLLVE